MIMNLILLIQNCVLADENAKKTVLMIITVIIQLFSPYLRKPFQLENVSPEHKEIVTYGWMLVKQEMEQGKIVSGCDNTASLPCRQCQGKILPGDQQPWAVRFHTI